MRCQIIRSNVNGYAKVDGLVHRHEDLSEICKHFHIWILLPNSMCKLV